MYKEVDVDVDVNMDMDMDVWRCGCEWHQSWQL